LPFSGGLWLFNDISIFYGDSEMPQTLQSNLGANRRLKNKGIDARRISVRPTTAAIQLTRFTGSEDAILTKQFSLDVTSSPLGCSTKST
jgi:hypothetical protein